MIKTLLIEELRFLAFRPNGPAIRTHWKAFLAFGLFFTWLAGVGRYWDNPKAHLWQYLGLGSVAYVFVLAFIVFLLLLPLKPRNWTYRNVLLFIALTAPPAVLYAIPVEKFMAAEAARSANAWFLIVVATWRVALFVVFLKRVAGLSPGNVIVAALLPLVVIVIALSMLNLEHVVFSLMSGIQEADRSPNDAAYGIVFMLSMLSFIAAPFLAVGYLVSIVNANKKTEESLEMTAGRRDD
ncbi:MAG: hypothetical protein IPG33_10525 [Betaproteobacteria bacterium]|nr:hypothetical protein [Betaproteobacteria bacterium]